MPVLSSAEGLRELVLGGCEGPVLVHAPGAGLGHLTRALVIARALSGVPVTIRHHVEVVPFEPPPGVTLTPVRPERGAESKDAVLVADTFPGGLAGELDDGTLARFRRRVLVARYVRAYPDYERLAARYDVRLVPYPRIASEWDSPDGEHVGHLVRDLEVTREEAPLGVLGDAATLPPRWLSLLPAGTAFVRGWTGALPRAARWLSVGAGYNATYELARLGVPFGLVPRERRFDDQFRRADRLGRGVYSRGDLEAFLAGAGPWS